MHFFAQGKPATQSATAVPLNGYPWFAVDGRPETYAPLRSAPASGSARTLLPFRPGPAPLRRCLPAQRLGQIAAGARRREHRVRPHLRRDSLSDGRALFSCAHAFIDDTVGAHESWWQARPPADPTADVGGASPFASDVGGASLPIPRTVPAKMWAG